MVILQDDWTPQRKLKVVQAYQGGTRLDILAYQNGLTTAEIVYWNTAYRRRGLSGLYATRRSR